MPAWPVPDLPRVSSHACLLLPPPGRVPPLLFLKAQLQGPSPPQSSQTPLSEFTASCPSLCLCPLCQALRARRAWTHSSKSLLVPDGQRSSWSEADVGKWGLYLLTPQSAFPIGGVEFEQGLGHIDVSLEELNVVQDVQQNLLLPSEERQG